jgi:D-alanyl-D-alanine carboxypeptidase
VHPAKPPNYQLRRLVALTVLFLMGYSLWRITGAVGSALSGPDRKDVASSPARSTSPTASISPSAAIVAPPACANGNAIADQAAPEDWAVTLLDTKYRLPSSYVPPGLVSVKQAGFEKPGGGLVVRSLVVDDLAALRQAAAAAGNPIDVVAAYRSYQDQSSLFDRRKRDLGLKAAERKTARPGHSEHQLGTAVDFKTAGEVDVDVHWDSTPAGRWTLENAWRFGFVRSYPMGKSAVTCYAFEPWHYRYFGPAVAAAIHESGLTVREYLWNQSHAGP